MVDLNLLLHRHQLSLMRRDSAMTAEERRSHEQFARDYGQTIRANTAKHEMERPA